ncbi:MAG: protein DA1 [Calditrichaeota bacterium]|nr:MAG: protein DA1 [Calditrichota bacterium]
MQRFFILFLITMVCFVILSCSRSTHKSPGAGKPVICQQCNETIAGKYIVALNHNWHQNHFRCSSCGKKLAGAGYFEKNDKPFCQDCYHEKYSPKCAVCKQALTSKYTRDAWGYNFHSYHLKSLHSCFSCARLICKNITHGGRKYKDGRYMCNICTKSAINSPAKAQKYFLRIKKFMALRGLKLPKNNFPLYLVDLSVLRKSNPNDIEVAGRTEKASYEVNGVEKSRRIEKMQVLDGLPAEHFTSILAHEFGHAWLFLNNYPHLDLQVEEGLCELFEYLWLRSQNSEISRFRIKKMKEGQDRIYGAGFRKALAGYKKYGLTKLLNEVKRQKRFPR